MLSGQHSLIGMFVYLFESMFAPDQILSFLETVGYVSFTWLLVYSGHIAAKKCLE